MKFRRSYDAETSREQATSGGRRTFPGCERVGRVRRSVRGTVRGRVPGLVRDPRRARRGGGLRPGRAGQGTRPVEPHRGPRDPVGRPGRDQRRHRPVEEAITVAADTSHRTARTIRSTMRRADLVRALRALPRRQREAVVLRHLLDLTERDTASAMGCTDRHRQERDVAWPRRAPDQPRPVVGTGGLTCSTTSSTATRPDPASTRSPPSRSAPGASAAGGRRRG